MVSVCSAWCEWWSISVADGSEMDDRPPPAVMMASRMVPPPSAVMLQDLGGGGLNLAKCFPIGGANQDLVGAQPAAGGDLSGRRQRDGRQPPSRERARAADGDSGDPLRREHWLWREVWSRWKWWTLGAQKSSMSQIQLYPQRSTAVDFTLLLSWIGSRLWGCYVLPNSTPVSSYHV